MTRSIPSGPWSAEAEALGCRWRAETRWNAAAEHWEASIACEGELVVALHLDPASLAAGACVLADAAAVLDPAVRRALEARLDAALDPASVGEPARSTRQAAREDVLARIAAAFRDATMPSTADELTTGGIDGPYVVEHFLGKARGDLEDDFLPGLHMEDFTYMTPGAVAYYLPAVLRMMMEPSAGFELWVYLHGFLKPTRDEVSAGVRDLAPDQLAAIGAWAAYLYETWLVDPPAIRDAVEQAHRLARAYRAADRDGSSRAPLR